MRNRFERQLLELNNELIQMGSMIERAIEMGISALVRQDVEKAKKAIAYDEEIDEQEKTVESLCMKLLLQQQPVAKDLRLISAALKMITDMERIGDHAADISEMTILMSDATYERSAINIDLVESMAKETTDMVIKCVDAFVNKDLELARTVIAQDDVVDDLFADGADTVVGTQAGTTGFIYATSDIEDAGLGKIERYNKGADAVQALLAGKIDCVVIDSQPAKEFVEANEGLTILDTEYAVEDYAIALNKDNTELLDKVNAALKELTDDGTIQSILDKYITAD